MMQKNKRAAEGLQAEAGGDPSRKPKKAKKDKSSSVSQKPGTEQDQSSGKQHDAQVKAKKTEKKEPAPLFQPALAAPGVSANWEMLKQLIGAGKRPPKTQSRGPPSAAAPAAATPASAAGAALTRILALDCEMVGTGPDGTTSALARVCLVNSHGAVVMDTHVAPSEPVTDYRTHVSGVRPEDLRGAPTLLEVQKQVAEMIAGRVLVGHALRNDFKALLLSHPKRLIRDTAAYAPLMQARPPPESSWLQILKRRARRISKYLPISASPFSSPLSYLPGVMPVVPPTAKPPSGTAHESPSPDRDVARSLAAPQSAPRPGAARPELRRGFSKKLRELAAAHLGMAIQDGEHSPAEDARAALMLYQKYAKPWEASIRDRYTGKHRQGEPSAGEAAAAAGVGAKAGAGSEAGGVRGKGRVREAGRGGGGGAAGEGGKGGGAGKVDAREENAAAGGFDSTDDYAGMVSSE